MLLLSDEGEAAAPHPMPRHGDGGSLRAGSRSLPPAPVLGLVGVAAAYYLGSLLGLELRFPPATTSVLWPPNAILTAALLMVPPRRFWLVLLAVAPAHFAAQLPGGTPLLLSTVWFATNGAQAVLAAGLVHRWSDQPARFDSLRRVVAFIAGAVLVAPFVTSFADAAAVHAIRGEPMGLVFVRRLFSNILGQLVVVPSAIVVVRGTRRWLSESTPRRLTEGILLAAAHLAIGGLVLQAYHGSFDLPGGPFTALPLLMPLLVAAAVRFGPGGASLSLLATTLIATCIAVWRATSSGVAQAEERALALQVFLIVVGAPLLCLSALVEERGQAAATLRARLRFEELVSQISASFVHVPSGRMRDAFADALARLGTSLGLDAAVLSNGGPPAAAGAMPGHEPIVWVDRSGPMSSALADREWMTRVDPRALLSLPLESDDEALGSLVLVSVPEGKAWPESEMERARLVADVFASALARQRASEALRASEVLNWAVLTSLPHQVAVLDHAGRIVAVNESWTRFIGKNCPTGGSGVGEDYLDHLRTAGGPRPGDLLEICTGIENVLAGRAPTFGGEYMTPVGDRWVHVNVVPLNRPEGGVVLSYADVHERRLAETQAHQLRDELAHCLRLSTIGELTSSIAHELNQPLAAILANAQAARRLLAGVPPQSRHQEIDEILDDIISEDRRAGEVIRGVRQLLRKGERQAAEVDVNALVREALKLVANDAMLREVSLRRTLALARVLVRGDRVQIQQVLLNLLLNALEAMPDGPGERTICVSTDKGPLGMATVSVTDTGHGLPSGTEAAVFDPFYTTKPNGLGMGLSIARSIVEAHGGTISAGAGGSGGATVSFTLPLAEDAPR